MLPLFYTEKTESTQFEILNLLKQKAQNCALHTHNQTNGRGQYGSKWEIKPNENLAYSFAIRAKDISCSVNLFNYHTAEVVRDFIANLTNENVEIKWPNDIILKSKKISGMIIDKTNIDDESFFIIGIGINVLQSNFENFPKASSLNQLTNLDLGLKKFTEDFHNYFSKNISIERTESEILQKFNQYLFRKDKISVFEINGIRQNGIIKNADEKGNLWVDLENDGLKNFFHKEISLLY